MRGYTHLAVGIAGAICAARALGVHDLEAVACVAAGGIGGLLPDIDHPRATISKYTPGVGHLIRIFISHRGLTHTLAFVALVMATAVAIKLPIALAAAFTIGVALHLVADMLTVDGIPLFMPVSLRSWRILPYSILWVAAPFLEQLTVIAAIIIPTLAVLGVKIGDFT